MLYSQLKISLWCNSLNFHKSCSLELSVIHKTFKGNPDIPYSFCVCGGNTCFWNRSVNFILLKQHLCFLNLPMLNQVLSFYMVSSADMIPTAAL